jgi:hypothetical protein
MIQIITYSERYKADFIRLNRQWIETGENICIDGGMTRQMIYHGDNGWKLESK